jgi:small ligand-binding sensory domain FIST
VSVRIGCGLSTGAEPRVAAIEAGQQARAQLDGQRVDAVAVFCSGEHLSAPEATLEGVHEALAPPVLVGCGAAGVLGEGREVERGTAVVVWAAALGDGAVEPFHARLVETDDGGAVAGLPDLEGAAAAILLPDPHSFPTAGLLERLPSAAPGVPVIGGLASAQTT